MNNSNNNNLGPFVAESIFQREYNLSGMNFSNGYLNTEKSGEIIPQVSLCTPCIDIQEEICLRLPLVGNKCKSIPFPGRWKLCGSARITWTGPKFSLDLQPC